MRPVVRRHSTNLTVNVTTMAPPQVQQPAPAPPVTPAAPTTAQPATPAVRSYAIQQGDTLATISAVFYGDVKHWRLLVDANPGLDPARLTVGATISIPPLPAP